MKFVLRILFAVAGIIAAALVADGVGIVLGVVLAFAVGEVYMAFCTAAANKKKSNDAYVVIIFWRFGEEIKVCYAGTDKGELCIFKDESKAKLLAEFIRRRDLRQATVERYEPEKEYQSLMIPGESMAEFVVILME